MVNWWMDNGLGSCRVPPVSDVGLAAALQLPALVTQRCPQLQPPHDTQQLPCIIRTAQPGYNR